MNPMWWLGFVLWSCGCFVTSLRIMRRKTWKTDALVVMAIIVLLGLGADIMTEWRA